MKSDLSNICIMSDDTICKAMKNIDANRKGIVLVVDNGHRLLGTISDGDIRRAVLSGKNLDTKIGDLLLEKSKSLYPEPIVATTEADVSILLELMREKSIHQIPIVDNDRRVTDLVTMEDIIPARPVPMQVVIMAGGYGTRMDPLTRDTPKPMLPLGDRPLMELMIENLKKSGIKKVNITTHHLHEKITEYFGDGSNHGVELNYIKENESMGTGGALGLMNLSKEPILVINGDLLTKVDFRAMLAFHREQKADMTVAVRQYDIKVPYGVVHCEGELVRSIEEKPILNLFVNAGMYLMEPYVCKYVPRDKKYDMTDLIQKLIENGSRVASFPVVEYWLDIGQHDNYKKAIEDVSDGTFSSKGCLDE